MGLVMNIEELSKRLSRSEHFLKALGLTEESIEKLLNGTLKDEFIDELGTDLSRYRDIYVSIDYDEDEKQNYLFFTGNYVTRFMGGKAEAYYGLADHSDALKFLDIKKIIVGTEWDKEQLIRASKYFHDMETTNTDLIAVNWLAHLYIKECHDFIEVVPPQETAEEILAEKYVVVQQNFNGRQITQWDTVEEAWGQIGKGCFGQQYEVYSTHQRPQNVSQFISV